MNKKKIMSLIMALVMLVGVFSPLTALAAGEKNEVTEKVTLHKLVMSKEDLAAWNSDEIQNKENGYNGTQNTDQLKALLKEGHSAKEVAGVYFAVKDSKGKYVTIKDGATPEYGRVDSLEAQLPDGFKLLAGKTGSKGIEFNTKGLKGAFTIEEIHEKSSYTGEAYVDKKGNELVKNTDGTFYKKGDKNKTEVNKNDVITVGTSITGSKAVPVEITLPLVNNDGVVKEAHVYPKNTEDKPKIDKNFDKEKEDEEKNKLVKESDIVSENKNLDLDLNDNSKDKATVSKKVGDIVPYKVVTEIPAQTKWATAKWDDKMTEGLTYNKGSLSIELKKGTETVTLTKGTDYTLTEDNNGFVLNFEKTGLEKLNNQDETQNITLKYTATLNNKAVADVEESNDITFHYGNKPGHGNTPIPNKPKNGEMEFTKSWDGEAPANASVTVQLYNANTGKAVGEAKTLNAGNSWKATWTGLDNDTEYKVVETAVAGYEAEYSKGDGLGKLGVKNWKSDNPTPLNPSEPKVVNGGKKFVKTNEKEGKELERLAGAEFYVINNIEGDANKGKYLVTKEKTTTNIATAKKALEDAVKAYNGLTAEEQKGQKGTEAKNLIDQKQEAYNKAIKENASDYEWGEKTDANVVVLTSDTEGRFEITGLAYGSYKLEEKTPPAGFAKLSGDVDFTVGKGSYDGKNAEGNGPADKHIQYNKANTDKNYGQRVVNKKVSIPQTGGMGTVLFTVVGISLMAGAVIAMKKNREEA
ncbi:MAG: pilin N-terminal domain-containing protein [Peptoniphilus harei]|nr:pilin N-terminal domain-containing protein [Peptoniphilus harei]